MKPALFFLSALLLFPASFLAHAEGKPLLKVIGYQAKIEQIPQTLEVLGQLQAKQSVNLMSNVTETVQAIHFKDGQSVQPRQLLVELNDLEERAKLKQIDVIIAEAKRQYDRANQIKNTGSMTESVIDERFRQWQSALAERKIIEAQIADRRLVAPFQGQLGFRQISQGDLVTPGTLITTLDDTQEMLLDIQIPSRFLAEVHLGQTVSLTTPAFEETFHGKLTAIAPRVDANTRQLQLRALVPNPKQKLKSGLFVNAHLTLPNRKALTVPSTAIFMLGEKQFVYRLTPEDNHYRLQRIPVVTGERHAQRIEILSGLQADELVVSQGIMKLGGKKKVQLKALENEASLDTLLQGKRLTVPATKD